MKTGVGRLHRDGFTRNEGMMAALLRRLQRHTPRSLLLVITFCSHGSVTILLNIQFLPSGFRVLDTFFDASQPIVQSIVPIFLRSDF